MTIEEQMALEKVKIIRSKYLIIRDLCFLMESILPRALTKNMVNDYDELLMELGSKERGIFNLLVHELTLLHRMDRLKRNGYYISESEDILMALQLMGSRINPMGFIDSRKKQYYLALDSYFGNTVFKREEVMPILGLRKTHSQRVLNALSKSGLIYKHPRKGSLGYLYQIMEKEKQ